MELSTDLPSVQVYTSDHLPETMTGKNGAAYGPRSGVCLEAQFYPDSPNHADFPSTILLIKAKRRLTGFAGASEQRGIWRKRIVSKILKSPAKYVQGPDTLRTLDQYLQGMGNRLLIIISPNGMKRMQTPWKAALPARRMK